MSVREVVLVVWNLVTRPLVAIAVLTALHTLGCSAPPDDKEMMSRFEDNRSKFERLVDLIDVELDERIGDQQGRTGLEYGDWLHVEKSAARELMSELGIEGANATYGMIYFRCTSRIAMIDYAKGYHYRASGSVVPPIAPANIVEELDGLKLGPNQIKYVRIDENWFLYYQRMSN